MKKILLAVIIIAFTSCSKAQNPEFEEEKLSLLKEISESEEQLKTIIELAELNDTPLKLSIGRTLEPKPIELPPIKADLNKLQKEIKTLSWEQNFIDNQTIISVEEEIFDNYPNIDLKEVVLENIKFYDNKKFDQTVKADFEYYDIEFPLDVKRKRIKSFDLKFLIESDEYLNFSINEKKSTIAALKIKDIKIKNKTITFVKEKTDDEKDFEIYVSDRDGLFYESISSSSVTKFSEEEIKYYKSLLMHFKDLKKALNNNDFANEEVFKKYSEKNQPKEVSKSEENELYNFDFSVNPKNIIFRVLGNKYTEQLIVSFSEDLDKNKFIAKSNRKYGLIDVNGKWIIEPTDDYLSGNFARVLQ